MLPQEWAAAVRSLARQAVLFNKNYKLYMDFVGAAQAPENDEDRLIELFPATFSPLRLLHSMPRMLPSQKLDVLRSRYQHELRWQFGNPNRKDSTLRRWIEAIVDQRLTDT